MLILQRVKKVVNWLIYMEFATDKKDLAEKLGYEYPLFSQVINGEAPLPDEFINRLCLADKHLNEVWINTGNGNMLNNNKVYGNGDITLKDAWLIITAQYESLMAKDRQIDELISLLKEQIKTQNEK